MGLIPGLGISPGGGPSSTLQYLTCRTAWTEEPSKLQSIDCKKLDTAEVTEHERGMQIFMQLQHRCITIFKIFKLLNFYK